MDWDEELRKYTGIDWEAERECVKQTGHPEYYCRPFHAYPDGNLGWQPAHEVEVGAPNPLSSTENLHASSAGKCEIAGLARPSSTTLSQHSRSLSRPSRKVAAQSVHAAVFSPDPELDEDGDGRLRRSYSACMKSLMDKYDARAVANVVDIGCATGLSSLELARAFPGARVAGVDLSEYFLSVAEWNRRQAGENSHEHSRIQYHHAMGEATGLPSCSADLVSTCLVFHELPQDAAVGILKEAYRLLRPGGALAIMEMNPKSPAFQRIANNVMAFTAFKSTEPYLDQYTSLDLHGQIAAQGFALSDEVECSPRHRTVVAIKR